MSAALRVVGEALHLGPALALAAEGLVDPAEPYELGLALSVGEGVGLLVSYNPRTRGTGARRRMLQVLAQAGLPVDAARAALSWVPDERCSTVLGLEWHPGAAQPRATLYLEEITRFYDPAAIERTTARLAALAGVPAATLGDDPGEPYIWALDLDRTGVQAFKTYRLASDRDAVLRRVAQVAGGPLVEPWGPALAGGVSPSGFILQRRHRPGQRPALKVYKTWPYLDGGGGADAATEVASLLGPLDPAGWLTRLVGALGPGPKPPLTSLGLRLGSGSPVPLAATAYWCLARGPGPSR